MILAANLGALALRELLKDVYGSGREARDFMEWGRQQKLAA